MGPHLPSWGSIFDMGKFTEKLKSVFVHRDSSVIPDKQIDRWEGEGGSMLPTPKSSQRPTDRDRTGGKNDDNVV